MRRVAFAVSGLVSGTLAFGLLLGGWIAVPLLLLTPLATPALVGFRAVVGAAARVEALLANRLLGTEVSPDGLTSGGAGYWGRAKAVADDVRFWREQAYLLLRVIVAWPVAVAVVSLAGGSLWLLGLPISYRLVDEDVGSWHINTLERAVLAMPLGVIGLVLSYFGALGFSTVWQRAALPLLGEPRDGSASRLLRAHALATVLANAVVLVVWFASGLGAFWPGWVMLGTGLALALHAARGLNRRLGALAVFTVLVWVMAGRGYFWPVWSLLAFGIVAGIAAIVRQRGGLEERIDVLETTRAGAVDQQETELRRIERDLHDGAQARLVALGMNLGMAEQKLAADPDAARGLVAEARAGVEEALRELRDLARGIHPPVLSDRGLEAAIQALAHRSAIPVTIDAAVAERPPAAVETAAYFVAAEAMTNAAKHAGATRIEVRLARRNGRLVVEVEDDGCGGADPAGSGITGLRRRVEALDGTLTITSPSGGGTTLRAELPCAS